MAKRILIVDDEPHILKMVSARLKSFGFDIATAENGQEGLAKARQFRPDLMIVDVMMPVMDGPTMAEKIRDDLELGQIPMIFLTALVKKEEQKAQDGMIGGNYVIAKPFDAGELLGMVQKLLP